MDIWYWVTEMYLCSLLAPPPHQQRSRLPFSWQQSSQIVCLALSSELCAITLSMSECLGLVSLGPLSSLFPVISIGAVDLRPPEAVKANNSIISRKTERRLFVWRVSYLWVGMVSVTSTAKTARARIVDILFDFSIRFLVNNSIITLTIKTFIFGIYRAYSY